MKSVHTATDQSKRCALNSSSAEQSMSAQRASLPTAYYDPFNKVHSYQVEVKRASTYRAETTVYFYLTYGGKHDV